MEREYKRMIIKFKDEAEYYQGMHGKSTRQLRHPNGNKIKTIVTADEYLVVANQHAKVKMYADGRIEIENHDNKTPLKIK